MKLNFSYCRPFGIEAELNAVDGVAETKRDAFPKGIHDVANLISSILDEYVEVRGYGNTHWYKTLGHWVLKPDNSCGIEVCSPVSKGWVGLRNIVRVIEAFSTYDVSADNRCSFHVHIGTADLSTKQIANVLRWWIKCEPVFFDSVPSIRKNSKFCQFFGLLAWEMSAVSDQELIDTFGFDKYLSANAYHLASGDLDTLEFRLGEHELCKNVFFVKNWIRLLIHFFEVAKDIEPDNLGWLDLEDVINFLGFNGDLTAGMKQIRNWFLARVYYNHQSAIDEFFKHMRIITSIQVNELINKFDIDPEEAMQPILLNEALYGKIYSS